MKTPRVLVTTLFALALFAAHGAQTCRAQDAPAPAVVIEGPPKAQAQTPVASQRQVSGASTVPDAAPKSARAAMGAIKGRVVGDAGEPLAGITVYATPRASGANSRSQRTAIADDEGNFTIGGLEPGLYSLGASLPGYVPEVDTQTGRPSSTYRPGETATLRLVRGGVITGAVTDPQGEPLVAVSVRAFRVRDLDGRAPSGPYAFSNEDRTDDRGVYRIYGLQPGVYVVLAGGSSNSFGPFVSPFGGDAPTFYPSSTRDTAAEVTVRSGQDAAGVDIRYRDEPGHRITGKVETPAPQTGDGPNPVSVSLFYASSGVQAGSAFVLPNSSNNSFSLEAVADGDYDIQATSGSRDGINSTSVPQRITVRGADVTGLRLALAPLASASGTLVIEPASEQDRARDACKNSRASQLPQETLVSALAERPSKGQALSRVSTQRDATPDPTGAFTLRNLEQGRYRLALRLFDEALYARSVQLPASSATPPPTNSAAAPNTTRAAAQRASAPAPTARDIFDIKSGQQLNGITVRLAEGAAFLSGHVVAEGPTIPPFAQLRVYLVPAEREHEDDTLRFYEATPTADGTFSLKNLAPGRYLVLARLTDDASDAAPRPASWDADSRARLRRDAESANNAVELQPCQRTTDFNVRLPPPPK